MRLGLPSDRALLHPTWYTNLCRAARPESVLSRTDSCPTTLEGEMLNEVMFACTLTPPGRPLVRPSAVPHGTPLTGLLPTISKTANPIWCTHGVSPLGGREKSVGMATHAHGRSWPDTWGRQSRLMGPASASLTGLDRGAFKTSTAEPCFRCFSLRGSQELGRRRAGQL